MRFAEVFLRLGSALVAWMVIFAYVLFTAILFRLECGPDGDEMHRLLLGLAPMAIFGAWVIRVTKPLGEVHKILVGLSLLVVVLLPFAVRSTWEVFQQVNLNAASICPGAPAAWQVYWAPIQFVSLIILTGLLIWAWRGRASD